MQRHIKQQNKHALLSYLFTVLFLDRQIGAYQYTEYLLQSG